jgi:hypothetical protein
MSSLVLVMLEAITSRIFNNFLAIILGFRYPKIHAHWFVVSLEKDWKRHSEIAQRGIHISMPCYWRHPNEQIMPPNLHKYNFKLSATPVHLYFSIKFHRKRQTCPFIKSDLLTALLIHTDCLNQSKLGEMANICPTTCKCRTVRLVLRIWQDFAWTCILSTNYAYSFYIQSKVVLHW